MDNGNGTGRADNGPWMAFDQFQQPQMMARGPSAMGMEMVAQWWTREPSRPSTMGMQMVLQGAKQTLVYGDADGVPVKVLEAQRLEHWP